MDIPVDPIDDSSELLADQSAGGTPQATDPLELIATGAVPAATVPPGLDDPIVDQIANGFVDAAESGTVDFFDSSAGDTVLFNPTKIDRATLEEADRAGKLYEVAPPVTELGGGTPTPEVSPGPAAAPTGLDIPDPAPMALPNPSGAAIRGRQAALRPATPTRRPNPGAGELQNGIAKRPV